MKLNKPNDKIPKQNEHRQKRREKQQHQLHKRRQQHQPKSVAFNFGVRSFASTYAYLKPICSRYISHSQYIDWAYKSHSFLRRRHRHSSYDCWCCWWLDLITLHQQRFSIFIYLFFAHLFYSQSIAIAVFLCIQHATLLFVAVDVYVCSVYDDNDMFFAHKLELIWLLSYLIALHDLLAKRKVKKKAISNKKNALFMLAFFIIIVIIIAVVVVVAVIVISFFFSFFSSNILLASPQMNA